MRRPLALFVALAGLAAPAPAGAVVRHVDVTADEDDGSCAPGDCSLREAVRYAPPGATIDVPAGTYSLSTQLVVPRPMTIDGAGPGATTITAGGAHRVLHDAAGPVTLRDLEVTGGNGNGTGNGGGILDSSTRLLTLEHVRVTDNHAEHSAAGSLTSTGGGGIAVDGPATLRRSVVDGNSASLGAGNAAIANGGGGIHAVGGAVTLVDSEVRDNHVLVQGATTSDENVKFNGGGGIFVENVDADGSIDLLGSTVAENSVAANGQTKLSENGGGGIYAYGEAPLSVLNSTISDNEVHVPVAIVDNGGGGIFTDGSSAALENATIAGNVATGTMDAGGALYREGGRVTAHNTIIAANSADADANCFGSLASTGRNLEDQDTCGLRGPGDRVAEPVMLGPLAFNGGPTRTRAIFAGGPAFNTADRCPARDQRGVARPPGACDRGAYEVALPLAETFEATARRTRSARLIALVVPNGQPTTYYFRFGRTRRYGRRTAVRPAGAGFARRRVRAPATGLEPATIYHYRVVATNALGTTIGGDGSFVTRMRLPAGCVEDRALTVPVGRPKGRRVVSARASADREHLVTVRGADVKRLVLQALPKHAFTLRVYARLDTGRTVFGVRRYLPCS